MAGSFQSPHAVLYHTSKLGKSFFNKKMNMDSTTMQSPAKQIAYPF